MGKVNSYPLTVNRKPLSLLPSANRPPRKRKSIIPLMLILDDECGVKHGLPSRAGMTRKRKNPQFPLPSQQSDRGLGYLMDQKAV
jgi:hypothetical protein